MIQIGKKAPDFSAEAFIDNAIKKVRLHENTTSYKLLFFYPLNFTFVCPTEILALQEKIDAFKKRNVDIFGISVDSVHSHRAWTSMPRAQGGLEKINIPLVSDINKTISRDYGVLDEDSGVALRGAFLLDKNNVVHYAVIQNLSLGRNIDELLRVIDALHQTEKVGDVCPANWTPGKKTMVPNRDGLKEYFG